MRISRGSEYVALGSSFAAGPGLKPRAPGSPRRAGRSDLNYAHLVASRLGLRLDDVSFSGATTGELNGGPEGRLGQIAAVTPTTKLVTITAGGNDVGYLPALTFASLPWPVSLSPWLRSRVRQYIDPQATAERFSAMASSLGAVVRSVRDRAPNARILIVDYLTIIPASPTLDHQLSVLESFRYGDVAAWARDVSARLSETFSTVAADEACSFLDVALQSRDHHAWSSEPWTRRFHPSLRGGAPFHPNYEGMHSVASMILKSLE